MGSIGELTNTCDMEETMNQTTSVIESFDNTFESGNLVDTLSQVGEVGLDYALDLSKAAQILKDIPVLGLLVSCTKTIANIRSHALANKVFRFFYGIKDIPIEKRRKFAEEYCQANREDTAVTLLSILDRLNNQNYVPIICRLMKAKMDEEITILDFNRCILALERTAYTDLELLPRFVNDYYEAGVAEAFEAAGLVCLSVIDPRNMCGGQKMKLSRTGCLILKFGLGQDVDIEGARNIRFISSFG